MHNDRVQMKKQRETFLFCPNGEASKADNGTPLIVLDFKRRTLLLIKSREFSFKVEFHP